MYIQLHTIPKQDYNLFNMYKCLYDISDLIQMCKNQFNILLFSSFIQVNRKYCSDLLCIFVSKKITMFIITICKHNYGFWVSARWHYSPLPVFKEMVLSLKMWYRNIANTGVGSYIQEQGLCTTCTGASLGDLERF